MLAFYDRSDFADVVKKWYDGYREVLCYGIAFYKKNCKITVKKTKDSIISGIWGFIEGILILTGSINTDGRGIPLKE